MLSEKSGGRYNVKLNTCVGVGAGQFAAHILGAITHPEHLTQNP